MNFSFFSLFSRLFPNFSIFNRKQNHYSSKQGAFMCFFIGAITSFYYLFFIGDNDVVFGGVLLVTIWIFFLLALMTYIISFWDKSVRVVVNTYDKHRLFPPRKRNIVTQKNQLFFLVSLILIPFIFTLFGTSMDILEIYFRLSPIYGSMLTFYFKKFIKNPPKF